MDTRLLEQLDVTVISGSVKGSLARDHENGHFLQVHEFPHGVLLQPALRQIGSIGFLLFHGNNICRVWGRRFIVKRYRSESPRTAQLRVGLKPLGRADEIDIVIWDSGL